MLAETRKAAEDLKKAREDYENANKEMKKQSSKVEEITQDLKKIDQSAFIEIEKNLGDIKDDLQENINTIAEQVQAKEEEEIVIPSHKQESPVKLRPQTPVSPSDYLKKEEQKPKFEKIKVRIEQKKEEAAQKFKAGNYVEANKLYKISAE